MPNRNNYSSNNNNNRNRKRNKNKNRQKHQNSKQQQQQQLSSTNSNALNDNINTQQTESNVVKAETKVEEAEAKTKISNATDFSSTNAAVSSVNAGVLLVNDNESESKYDVSVKLPAHVAINGNELQLAKKPTVGTSDTVFVGEQRIAEVNAPKEKRSLSNYNESMGNNNTKIAISSQENIPRKEFQENIKTLEELKSNEAKIIVHRVEIRKNKDESAEQGVQNESSANEKLSSGIIQIGNGINELQLNRQSTVEIQEVESDDVNHSDLSELKSPIVSEVESDNETLKLTSSPESEIIDHYIVEQLEKSLLQNSSRKQKRIAIQNHFLPQFINPRYLDSISEENSDLSDCSERSIRKRQASLAESLAVLQTCGTLENVEVPKAEAAELVYINSTSSSASDLDILENMEPKKHSLSPVDLDTDITDLMTQSYRGNETPTKQNINRKIKEPNNNSKPNTNNQSDEFKKEQNKNNNNLSLLDYNIATQPSHEMIAKISIAAQNCYCDDVPQQTNTAATLLNTSECSSSNALTRTLANSRCETFTSDSCSDRTFEKLASQAQAHIHNAASSQIHETTSNMNTVGFTVKKMGNINNDSFDQNFYSSLSPLPPSPTTPTTVPIAIDSVCTQPSLLTSHSLQQHNVRHTIQGTTTQSCSSESLYHSDQSTICSLCTTIHNDDYSTTRADSDFLTSSISDCGGDKNPLGEDPKRLRSLCAEKLQSLPYGQEVLQELATVAESIGEAKALKDLKQAAELKVITSDKTSYPQASLPHIDALQLMIQTKENEGAKYNNSSWVGLPTQMDSKNTLCTAPHLEQTAKRNPQQTDDLISPHQELIERESYQEVQEEQRKEQKEHQAEKQLLQTAEVMKKLRKSLTPTPPPIPPPPVPEKSMETIAKAQNTLYRTKAEYYSTPISNSNLQEHDKITLLPPVHTNSTDYCGGEQQKQQQNCKRLIVIMNANERGENKQQQQLKSQQITSSHENSSRLTHNGSNGCSQQQASHLNGHTSQTTAVKSENSQSMDTNLNEFFKFDDFASSRPLSTKKKYFKSSETHTYEAKKRIENGKVIYDTAETKCDKQTEGNNDNNNNNNASNAKPEDNTSQKTTASTNDDTQRKYSVAVSPHDQEIMSDLNLNVNDGYKHEKEAKTFVNNKTNERTRNLSRNEQWSTKESSSSTSSIRSHQHLSNSKDQRNESKKEEKEGKCFEKEEFRQNASIFDEQFSTTKNGMTSSGQKPSLANFASADHEKLFKEFDELSKRLSKELEACNQQQQYQWSRKGLRSSSLMDLSTIHMKQRAQFEEFKRQRQEHMKELEEEIERSLKERQIKFNEYAKDPKAYTIPIHIENGSEFRKERESKAATASHSHTHQIPIEIEDAGVKNARTFGRAESMYELNNRKSSKNYNKSSDDWSRYAEDFGSSENITRPFAREVEICYQRQRPQGIRAPRLTASTNDLTTNSYDSSSTQQYKHHQPRMLSRAALQEQKQAFLPQYRSCTSMIERDPNPTYISTTSRRGTSTVDTTPAALPRRNSLPRDLHEQQLKYITDKEQQLRNEIERLQNERMRLQTEMDEHNHINESSNETQRPQRNDSYRPLPKLPPLTENEVFRQQMAEEWLNKVAEREQRRLHKIVKISKINHQSEEFKKNSVISLKSAAGSSDIGKEFLNRVKERRHKLEMPADSDWESGAESQPVNQRTNSEKEDSPNVTFMEGKAQADPTYLPKHLKEFAKYSTSEREKLDNGEREHFEEEERSAEVMNNMSSKALKKSAMTKTVQMSYTPDKMSHDCNKSKHLMPFNGRSKQSFNKPIKSITEGGATKRRSWSESDLLNEIDQDLKLAKGFLFQDGQVPSSTNMFSIKFKAKAPTPGAGIWSPHNIVTTPSSSISNLSELKSEPPTPPPLPSTTTTSLQSVVWTPQSSPLLERRGFRPIQFESPKLSKKFIKDSTNFPVIQPPWNNYSKRDSTINEDIPITKSGSDLNNKLREQSSKEYRTTTSSVVANRIKTFERSCSATGVYENRDKTQSICNPNEIIYNVKHEYMSEPESLNECPKRMAQLGRRQYDGIGPVTNDGMPITLRSEVKQPHQHEWYKRLYQTIHKQKHGDDYVIRYKYEKGPIGRHLYDKSSGYQSEPEHIHQTTDDCSTVKYRTTHPQRLLSVSSAVNVRNNSQYNNKSGYNVYGVLPNPIKSTQYSYKNQPGRIEDYVTGHSSLSEKEKQQQFDQTKLPSHYTEGNLARALSRESGYTSDSNLVFRKKDSNNTTVQLRSPLSPIEQKIVYKSVQAGGEPPLYGFRKQAPEKSKALQIIWIMIPEFPKKMPSFIPINQKKRCSTASTPKPFNGKQNGLRKGQRGSPIPSSFSSRHEKCFQSSETTTKTLIRNGRNKKSLQDKAICRSKSASAVYMTPRPIYSDSTEIRKITRSFIRSLSPPQSCSLTWRRNRINCSPVAFGRSISKERSYAEEKKRLENVLPLNRHTFEASTNILRDPSLKSPQDVKKAVRSIAQHAIKENEQHKEHSASRSCVTCRSRNRTPTQGPKTSLKMVKHYKPDYEHIEIIRDFKPARNKKTTFKRNSSMSLAKINSTFSVNTLDKQISRNSKNACKINRKHTAGTKTINLKKGKDAIKQYKYAAVALEEPFVQEIRNIETVKQANKGGGDAAVPHLSKPEQTTRWLNDQSKSLPQLFPPFTVYEEVCSHKSRCSSPNATILTSEYITQSEGTNLSPRMESETDDFSLVSQRKFSPTREIRVPPPQRHEMRSPSRRKIDSFRSSLREPTSHRIIRASSLSSADDHIGSHRGLYLCREMCHSASHLPNEPHSPTCPYHKHSSERFMELNKFYSTLERIGQLEKCTSSLDFKPLRKNSDLLDYQEWCKVRSHEKAAKEMNQLIKKLRQEQREKDLLYRSKDPLEMKWHKENDMGLNSKERSVEDLKDNFERIKLFHDFQQRSGDCYKAIPWLSNPTSEYCHKPKQPSSYINTLSQHMTSISGEQPITEEYIITVDGKKKFQTSPLKVRCHSTLTKEQLLSNVNRKKAMLVETKRGVNKNEAKPPKIPPRPIISKTMTIPKQKFTSTPESKPIADSSKSINQKIKYFEECKYTKPPKVIYHAREESSTDEEEIMRMIDERIRSKEPGMPTQHKELSTSLTDLTQLYGERPMQKVNFRTPTPPRKPPEVYNYDYQTHVTDMEGSSPLNSSSLFYEEDVDSYRSRSLSPSELSRSSSYLHRVNTGEVRKIKEKFENLQQQHQQQPHERLHFFGLRKLRKVRSDPELLATVSVSKDTLEEGKDAVLLKHKFGQLQKFKNSPTNTPNAPKTIYDKKSNNPEHQSKSITHTAIPICYSDEQTIISNSTPKTSLAANEQNKSNYARINKSSLFNNTTTANKTKLSTNIKNALATFWPKKYEHQRKQQPLPSTTTTKKISSSSCSSKPKDIFANQVFNPKIHQPKARYVPKGHEIKVTPKRKPSLPTKKGAFVKFKVSPNRYYESDVNIHFKTPVCHEFKSHIPEEELAIRQADYMQKLYQEERRRKYLQELQDMNARRHADNFIPSQKSPIALNRYDDFSADLAPKSPIKKQHPWQQCTAVARALYNFQGQNSRELSFKKGDVIYIRRSIDKNWYEGEHNAMLGIFPANYVEILSKDGLNYAKQLQQHQQQQRPPKPSEGQARAKYNFQAQSGIELSLNKGELVALTRRVDENWFEGRIANRKGIFPVSYVEVLTDIGAEDIAARTVVAPQYQNAQRPSTLDGLRSNINAEFNNLLHGQANHINSTSTSVTTNGILKGTHQKNKTEILHVDTSTVPIVYRALYKYRPQNSDELELAEGDVVHVLEKCDDGWYVGTSQRTGCFGTFPGNYMERA